MLCHRLFDRFEATMHSKCKIYCANRGEDRDDGKDVLLGIESIQPRRAPKDNDDARAKQQDKRPANDNVDSANSKRQKLASTVSIPSTRSHITDLQAGLDQGRYIYRSTRAQRCRIERCC